MLPEGSQRRGRNLWHDSGVNPPSLGCMTCPDLDTCGGLRVAAALYSCFDLCRCPPASCKFDAVCRRQPAAFVNRWNEVGGFELDNIARTGAALYVPALPVAVPFVYHGRTRERPFVPDAAAVSLYDVISWKDGSPRHGSAAAMRSSFGLGADVPLVLSGTATDPTIERWWSHGAPRRRQAIGELRGLSGDIVVTVPNYSLFRDMPRWDDLHSMKRIAIAWWEFMEGGVAAALHLNARTERDYERWTRFVSDRPEVTHVAFEFGTSAGKPGRREWHATQLATLAASTGRPLHILARGGLPVLRRLAAAFAEVTLIDTTAFLKTMMRRRLDATLAEEAAPTARGEPLDELIAFNSAAMRAAASAAVGSRAAPTGKGSPT